MQMRMVPGTAGAGAARRYARSNFPFGRCVIVYKQTNIEQDATPVGLGMQAGDDVLLFPTFGKFDVQGQMKDRSNLGLGFSFGVIEGGVPFPLHQGGAGAPPDDRAVHEQSQVRRREVAGKRAASRPRG